LLSMAEAHQCSRTGMLVWKTQNSMKMYPLGDI
jgi:hypothetical protein